MRLPLTCVVLVLLCVPVAAQDGGKTALDKLQTLQKPTAQQDLNPLALASAHRERAESMDDRTSGLWQSWLVSICEGCGPDRQPFTDRDGQRYLQKLRAAAPQAGAGRPRSAARAGSEAAATRTLSADLSNAAIDQIRRDPNR